MIAGKEKLIPNLSSNILIYAETFKIKELLVGLSAYLFSTILRINFSNELKERKLVSDLVSVTLIIV